LAFQRARIPVVHSFGKFVHSPRAHVVGIDNIECGRMAARTLIARGYKSVGFLGGPKNATSTIDRRTGFFDVIGAQTEVTATSSFATAYSFDAGRAEMLALLKEKPAEAYFCGDDVLSVGALSAIQESGLRAPDDIGVIGLNDMDMARWQNINLTTIRQPVHQIIDSSIDLVTSMLDDPQRHPEARLFACEIIERGTLRPLPKAKISG
ncbi:MAG: substrate-binding domain-containing protein, partial [Lentilitoribacter sp.]